MTDQAKIETKEVCVLGGGFSRNDWDYHCETWGCNFSYRWAKRLDKLFFTDSVREVELHHYVELEKLQKLKPQLVFPIIYPKFRDIGLPIEIYPIKEVRQQFQNTEFFCSSFDYIIAYAIYKGYQRIYAYGLDYEGNVKEELLEKPGVAFWLGVAVGRGTEVVVANESSMLHTYDRLMYGEFGLHANS